MAMGTTTREDAMKTIEIHHLLLALSVVLTMAWAGCSSPEEKPDPQPSQTTAVEPEPEPECLSGCMLSGEGKCQIEANSMDWNSTSTEIVPCDPRCCEEGVDPVDTAGPDTDGDGILDENDQCPDQAEDNDQFEDEDGCPDPDNDGDGIPDVDDLCPLDAEDVDGFQDKDGCLDP
jgi:hypothetical protein